MKDNLNDKPTHVNLKLDKVTNDILSKSAKINNRTKRAEAAIRLKDHLTRFSQHWSLKDTL